MKKSIKLSASLCITLFLSACSHQITDKEAEQYWHKRNKIWQCLDLPLTAQSPFEDGVKYPQYMNAETKVIWALSAAIVQDMTNQDFDEINDVVVLNYTADKLQTHKHSKADYKLKLSCNGTKNVVDNMLKDLKKTERKHQPVKLDPVAQMYADRYAYKAHLAKTGQFDKLDKMLESDARIQQMRSPKQVNTQTICGYDYNGRLVCNSTQQY